jgi:hypothetical protein
MHASTTARTDQPPKSGSQPRLLVRYGGGGFAGYRQLDRRIGWTDILAMAVALR